MSNELVPYPTSEDANNFICMPRQPRLNRRELTDTEKAIYLKLVELAKAGKIIWDARNAGNCGLYRVSIYDNTIQVIKTDEFYKNAYDVAMFDISGMQVAGDLATIASEQYDARKAQLAAEFLQA